MNNGKIVDYQIVITDSVSDFEEEIRGRLEMGYQPFGSPRIMDERDHYAFFQAMVKYEESSDTEKEKTAWYMRDNHTFKRLSADFTTAMKELREEFEADPYGMLTQGDVKTLPVLHAQGQEHAVLFMANAAEWLAMALK